jgi:hypothetical protein
MTRQNGPEQSLRYVVRQRLPAHAAKVQLSEEGAVTFVFAIALVLLPDQRDEATEEEGVVGEVAPADFRNCEVPDRISLAPFEDFDRLSEGSRNVVSSGAARRVRSNRN